MNLQIYRDEHGNEPFEQWLSSIRDTRTSEPFNCHKSLLWEGFLTPILVGGAHQFPIIDSENRKLNGSARTSARIDNRLKRVRLGLLGDQRSLSDGVFELRLDFGAGYRIYFGRIGREDILLLTGGDKTSQRRDIARAKRYWQHFRESMS